MRHLIQLVISGFSTIKSTPPLTKIRLRRIIEQAAHDDDRNMLEPRTRLQFFGRGLRHPMIGIFKSVMTRSTCCSFKISRPLLPVPGFGKHGLSMSYDFETPDDDFSSHARIINHENRLHLISPTSRPYSTRSSHDLYLHRARLSDYCFHRYLRKRAPGRASRDAF